MKSKILILAMLLGLLLIPKADAASIVISNVTILPSTNLWIGEDVTLKVYCNGTNSYIEIYGEDNSTIIANLTYNSISNSFDLTLPNYYFTEPNNFTAITYCSKENETVNQTINFSYSKFEYEYDISPSTIYKGDLVEVSVQVYKNDVDISNSIDISLEVYLNNSKVSCPYNYESGKGRVIYLDTSTLAGSYLLTVIITYDRISKTISIPFTVNDPIDFKINSISTTQLSSNSTFKLTITALERGNPIQLDENSVSVKIDNTNCKLISITPSGNSYILTLTAPNLSPDIYTLTATLNYGTYTYYDTTTVYYPINIEGRFIDQNGKSISTKITFYSNDQKILEIYTDSSGKYSGKISPGTYDIKFEFPQATLILEDVDIDSFEDPLKYLYISSTDIEGFNVVGLYVFETDLSYAHASLKLEYDEKNVLDESLIKAYKCEKWNSGKQICVDKWKEIDFVLDDVRNVVEISSNSLSAYALITLRSLNVDFELNKDVYHLKDLIGIRGIVKDEYNNQIGNVNVSVFSGTKIYSTTLTDINGLFTLEFLAPQKEGIYSYILKARKDPFISFNKTFQIKVEKSKDVSIVFPGTIRIYQGKNLSQEVKVVNIGQADLEDLEIALDGISSEYYLKLPKIEHLESGSEKSVYINFVIPSNATPTTLAATLKVLSQNFTKKKTFGLTILEKNETKESKPTGYFIKINFESIPNEVVYLLIIAIVSFSISIILKRRKRGEKKVNESLRYLIELKNYLENRQNLGGVKDG